MKYLIAAIGGILLIGIAGMLYLNLRHCPQILRRLSAEIFHRQYVPAADIQFHAVQMAIDGAGPHNSTWGGSSAISSDCVSVNWKAYTFATPGDAEQQFQEWLQAATKTISVIGAPGQGSKERAIFQGTDNKFHILEKEWNSAHVRTIESVFLEHAVLYEQRRNLGLLRTKLNLSANFQGCI